MIISKSIKIQNERGFHLSVVSKIESIAKKAEGAVFILYEKKKANAKDLFDMLSLCIKFGDQITIGVEKKRDELAIKKIIKIIEQV